MRHFEIDISDRYENNLSIDVFCMPLLDSRMYVLRIPIESTDACSSINKINTEKREYKLLIVDPNYIAEEDVYVLKKLCDGAVSATVFLTHSHYDHIAGVNLLRTLLPTTVIASTRCAAKLTHPRRNMSSYSPALLIERSDDEKRYFEEHFDLNYTCEADEIYDNEFEMSMGMFFLKTVKTPGHTDCSQCIELYMREKCSDINTKDNDEHRASIQKDGCWCLVAVFTGDSLVNGHDVILRLPTGSRKEYEKVTAAYLDSLEADIWIFPGHGEPVRKINVQKKRDKITQK